MHHYFPTADINVVEIDPEISQVAAQFFNFRVDDKLKVHIDDGRMFIREQLRLNPIPKYDIIILDAFNGDYIPFHLMTKEFLEEVKGILADVQLLQDITEATRQAVASLVKNKSTPKDEFL